MIELYTRDNQKNINTALPGKVEAFYTETITADITIPITRFQTGDDSIEQEDPWPVLAGVPVLFPGGGNWSNTHTLKNGDPVLVIFCQQDITNWFLSDGSEPVSEAFKELHGPSSAICIPRLYTRKNNKPDFDGDNYTIAGDGTFNVDADRVSLGAVGSTDAVCLASKQDPLNTKFALGIDILMSIFLPGVPPHPISPVAPTGSGKVFTDG